MAVGIKLRLRVAFVVDEFPVVSETFLINQVADLLDREVEVEIFAFKVGGSAHISSRYINYRMSERTHSLRLPASTKHEALAALPKVFRLLFSHPVSLFRVLNLLRHKRSDASRLYLLYSVMPFIGKRFDLVHCHYGTVANSFLAIKDILDLDVPLVTTFYGHDVSRVIKKYSSDIYNRLKRECALFFVMSNNMKARILAEGFPEEKVKVHPVSIDVASYPFSEREWAADGPVEIVSVGRFVEKKGFDDLLRALAIVKRKTRTPFRCSIIGGGTLEEQLRKLTSSLGLDDLVDFKGYMKIEDIIELLREKHIMIQPSKTASNGDME